MQTFSLNLWKQNILKSVSLLLLALFLSAQSFAQSTDATIAGKILDEKGEAIPGA
ncbi:MAG: hypothetical protein H7339_07430, partial [Arcicella sp.]|nr:hypothetical protein [Arcicella sp.]